MKKSELIEFINEHVTETQLLYTHEKIQGQLGKGYHLWTGTKEQVINSINESFNDDLEGYLPNDPLRFITIIQGDLYDNSPPEVEQ